MVGFSNAVPATLLALLDSTRAFSWVFIEEVRMMSAGYSGKCEKNFLSDATTFFQRIATFSATP